MTTNEQFQAFFDACEDLRNSKVILADSKLSAMLRSIVSTPALISVVGEALSGYNFREEYEALVSDNQVILPREPYRVIAFVFNLLNEFDSRKLDLQEFVHTYYSADTLAEGFNRFNAELIIPFRECLVAWASGDRAEGKESFCENVEQNREPKVEQKLERVEECGCAQCNPIEVDVVDEFFASVNVILTQIKDTVKLDSKIKSDRVANINITINALFEVTAMQNFKIFNALLISLKQLLNPVKSVRFYDMELENLVADFYSQVS